MYLLTSQIDLAYKDITRNLFYLTLISNYFSSYFCHLIFYFYFDNYNNDLIITITTLTEINNIVRAST